MTVSDNLATFFGKPVQDFAPEETSWKFAEVVPRFRLDYDAEDSDSIPAHLGAFISLPGVERTEAIVIGRWHSSETSQGLVEALVSYKDRLPDLRALFIGDIVSEENEISWINQSDLSPLWPAFPKLEHMQIRGANDLSLGRLAAPELNVLIIESGGLPMRVIREALAADAPKLRHFELWLGSENYGADSSPADFADLFAGKLFPNLQTLALRDCEYADALAQTLAKAPVLGRIGTLDLSMGNLTDEGAQALLASPLVAKLSRLDLHYHFLSDEMMARLQKLGPQVDVSEQEQADEYGGEIYRNIAVSE